MNSYLKTLTCMVLTVATAFGVAGTANADDTDIYLNPSVPSGSEPLVMFALDWRPNLGSTKSCAVGSYCDGLRAAGYLVDGNAAGSGASTTFFDILRAVLLKVLDPLGGVKIGFMLNHQDKVNCQGYPPGNKCSNGAYVLDGFKSMQQGSDDQDTWQTAGEDVDKVNLATKLRAIPMASGTDSHPYQGKELYFELFRYLTGQGVYNGHNGKVDFGDGPNDDVNLDVDRPAIMWDTAIETGGVGNLSYISPLGGASQCSKIFVINLMFQVSQQEDNSDNAILATKADGGMAGINLSGNNNRFATVIKYLQDVDLADGTFGTAPSLDGKQNVTSYFIVDPTKVNITTIGYANAGGTGAPLVLSDDPEVLVNALSSIFDSILSVSTTFVAPSVPVNVFNRSQILNEIYMALFEADENGLPFWPGNLKKLVINLNAISGAPELQDVNGLNAIDIDGRIKHGALTYWTDGGALPAPVDEEVAGKDGRSVARGGAGQKVTGFLSGAPQLANTDLGARQVFTEDAADVTDGLRDLNGDAATAAALWTGLTSGWTTAPSSGTYAGATTAEKNRAVNDLRWARGFAALDITDTTTMRPWFLGDPLHSRPRPINYGARGGHSDANPDIRIVMATSDGLLHMFRNTDTSADQDGGERWAFIPQEALGNLDRLRMSQTGVPVHPVGTDGSPAVLIIDNDLDGTVETADGDKVYVYFGMRRGGKSYYSLDISDPDAPKYIGKISKADAAFAELAQTWSTPAVGKIDVGAGPINVLVFGGGYNGDDDNDNLGDLGKDNANRNDVNPGADDDEGNAVFIVNAQTGALVWKAVEGVSEGYVPAQNAYLHPDLEDSIPSEIAAVDTSGNGLIDRLYFGDTGGVVWRADLAGNNSAAWTVTKLLNAGRHFNNSASNDLRFFNRPDLVRTRDSNSNFEAVLLGSGDREDPLDTDVQNVFFMIKDNATSSGTPPVAALTPDDLADLTVDCISDGSCSSATLNQLDLNGWMMDLGSSNGEKNLSNPVTLGGIVFFTDFIPGSGGSACDLSEGSGRQYAVDLQDARPVFNYNTANDGGGETLERFDELASGGIPVEIVPIGDNYILVQGQEAGQNIQQINVSTSWRTFWYEQ